MVSDHPWPAGTLVLSLDFPDVPLEVVSSGPDGEGQETAGRLVYRLRPVVELQVGVEVVSPGFRLYPADGVRQPWDGAAAVVPKFGEGQAVEVRGRGELFKVLDVLSDSRGVFCRLEVVETVEGGAGLGDHLMCPQAYVRITGRRLPLPPRAADEFYENERVLTPEGWEGTVEGDSWPDGAVEWHYAVVGFGSEGPLQFGTFAGSSLRLVLAEAESK